MLTMEQQSADGAFRPMQDLLDEVSHISYVHAHTEVATWQGLNGEGIIQIPGSRGIYAEQSAHIA